MTLERQKQLALLQQINRLGRSTEDYVRMPKALVQALVDVLIGDGFSEEWYTQRNADVRTAIEEKRLPSGREHYLLSGIYEGRMPFEVRIDERDYAMKYPDVTAAVAEGHFASEQDHFRQRGFAEGRSFRLLGGDAARKESVR